MKAKRMLSLGVAALLAVTGISALTGCARKSETVMTYGNHVIDENTFQYYLSAYKNVYLNTYTDFQDTADSYAKTIEDGRTVEEYLFDTTVENVAMTLVCMELFDQYHLAVSDALYEKIDGHIDDILTEYADGNRQTLNAILSAYGVNWKMLRTIYIDQEKSNMVYDYLYGESGVRGITEEDKASYLENNYCRVQHIYVNNAYRYVTDAEGKYQYGTDGYAQTEPLEEAEKAEKQKLIENIEGALAAGVPFAEVYEAYSEDQYYENGYYLYRGIDFIEEVTQNAFSMEIGEEKKIETEYGTHFIKRLPLETGAYADDKNADFFSGFEDKVKNDCFLTFVRTYLPSVQKNAEVLAKYSVEASPVNYRF